MNGELDSLSEGHNGAGLRVGKDGGVRLIGYLRVRAVGGVVEGAGFGEQDRQIRAWADRHGHGVVRTVVDRCSAGTPPSGLAAAARAVWAGEADAVVVSTRGSLGVHEPLGVRIMAVDEPHPAAPAGPAEPAARSWGKVGWAVAQWVAIAVAALVAYGVANAAGSGESPSSMEGTCVSGQIDAGTCDEAERVRVLDIAPPDDCTLFDSEPHLRRDGIWLCLQHR